MRSGQSIKLDVDVKGEPIPQLSWNFKGEQLKSTPFIRIENTDYITKLSITNCQRQQSGTYHLNAQNINGVDEGDVEINILDKPSKPEGPLKIGDIHKNGCKLKWGKPKDDGGTPIISYTVEKFDTETGHWESVCRADADTTELSIKGLEPNHRYQFRVKAVNDEGESPSLETESSILAKNPYDVPSPPGLPELEDWDENHVKLKWEPPLRNGGTEILGYIIEIMDKNSGEFVKLSESNSSICKGVAQNLEEHQQYKFRVRAVNKAGVSEPSEGTNWHTAKPRFRKYTCLAF